MIEPILIHLDASLTGLGAVFHNMVYSLPLNVVVACEVWVNHWSKERMKILCDNQAVVEVLTTGRCRDNILSVCARNIWLILAIYNFQIKIQHIFGHMSKVRIIESEICYHNGSLFLTLLISSRR